jgi:hypothetical protein
MNAVKRLLTVLVFLSAYLSVSAQKDLNIETLFNEYGKKEGSILIELGKDVLSDHTAIRYYKSLILNAEAEQAEAIEAAVSEDAKNGSQLMKSVKDGRTEMAAYCLARKAGTTVYEYILFSNKGKKMTLIYLNGHFSPDRLEDELENLKDLFIQVNNKQIKL